MHNSKYQCHMAACCTYLLSWYFELSQPQRITSWLKTMFNLSPIYSARKFYLHKTKYTQTSNTKFLKN